AQPGPREDRATASAASAAASATGRAGRYATAGLERGCLRGGPAVGPHVRPVASVEDGAGSGRLRVVVSPHGEQDAAFLDVSLVVACILFRYASAHEGTDQATSHRSDGRAAKRGRQGARRHNRADARDGERT